jgi:uncharacterized protein
LLALLGVAFALGLMGSAHCVAMCGGIVGALSAGVSPDLRKRSPVHAVLVLAYNVGRLVSYAALGALVGTASSSFGHAISGAQQGFRLAAGLLTVGVGLYIAGVLPEFARLERMALPVWRRISPLARRLLPVRTLVHALALGALWGWVPCGMVYTALAMSAATSSPALGAGTMVAFGLGTLPSMMLTGALAGRALSRAASGWRRHAAGALIAGLGLVTLATIAPRPRSFAALDAQVCVCRIH